jgi:sugar O-acyltransferase (sialic acid O-acetyltransferase NeuD family)
VTGDNWMVSPLIIVGATGNCLDIADAVTAQHDAGRGDFIVAGFLDDDPAKQGQTIAGFPVLGPISTAATFRDAMFVCGIGSPMSFRLKGELIARLSVPAERFATLIHPAACVSRSALLGPGTAILGNATICANVRIGAHVMMLPNCVVGHDTVISDNCIFAAGIAVSGLVTIARGCYIGAGAIIREGVSIGEGVLVGMGAVVVRDVAAGIRVAGNPARVLSPKSERD